MFVIRLPVNETHRRFRRRGRTPLRWLPFIFSDFKNIPPVFVTKLSVHHLHKRSRAARACPSGRHPFKIELSLQIVSAGIPPSDCLCILQIHAPFTERGVFLQKALDKRLQLCYNTCMHKRVRSDGTVSRPVASFYMIVLMENMFNPAESAVIRLLVHQ